MTTLQKFKLLATQCAVVGSPTRSPTASPVIHIRRRKTLRMLLAGGVFNRRLNAPPRRNESTDRRRNDAGKENIGVRLKLKDLFVSSSPPPAINGGNVREEVEGKRLLPASVEDSAGGMMLGRRGLRPLSATLRQRLLRRAWRPVLVGIPEQSPRHSDE